MSFEVNIHEAKTHFSKLLNRVLAGEDVVIAKAGVPIARIVPIDKKPEQRQPGSAKGKLVIADDFNSPLPDDLLRAFDGS